MTVSRTLGFVSRGCWNTTQTGGLETADAGAPRLAGWEPKTRCGQAWLPGGSRPLPASGGSTPPPPPSPLLLSLLAPVRLSCETLALTQDEPLSTSLAASADVVSPEEGPVPGTRGWDVPTVHLPVRGFSACFGGCHEMAQTRGRERHRRAYCCSSGGREVRDSVPAPSGSGEGPCRSAAPLPEGPPPGSITCLLPPSRWA